MLAINPAEAVTPPKPEETEIEILDNDELARLLREVRPTRSFPAILLAATTGMRRGEVLAVRWRDFDLDGAVLTVNQTVEETKAGLRVKTPKTKRSRRNITLPGLTVEALRRHRVRQLEERMKLGLGRDHDGLVHRPGGRAGAPAQPHQGIRPHRETGWAPVGHLSRPAS